MEHLCQASSSAGVARSLSGAVSATQRIYGDWPLASPPRRRPAAGRAAASHVASASPGQR